MSSGKHRAFSKHSATRPELPFLWSLKLASLNTRLLELRVNKGLQTEGLGGRSPSASLEVLVEAFFFSWPLIVQASLTGGWCEEWVTSLSLAPLVPLPPWALFLFLLAASTEDVHIAARVGGWGTTMIVGEKPPIWAINKAKRSRVFSSNPIPSGIWAPSLLVLT